MRLLFFLGLLLISSTSFAQTIFVNEYFNNSNKETEWVELVTTEDIDLRGFKLRDHTGSGNTSSPLVFESVGLWENVPAGTIVVIIGANISEAEDFDASDGLIVVKATNTTYLTGNQFNLGGSSDAVHVLDASDNHIHGISHGDNNASSLPSPKSHYSGSLSSGESLGYLGTTQISDLGNDSSIDEISSPTFGAGNDTDNTNFIISLRAPNEEPTIKVSVNGTPIADGDGIDFGAVFLTEEESITVQIDNLGENVLTIDDVLVSGEEFSISSALNSTQIQRNNPQSFTISFSPTSDGQKTGALIIESNDAENDSLNFILNGLGLVEGATTPISEVRDLAAGTVVSVAARVTVANEFEGPSYFQDQTGGLSIYEPDFHTAVQRGDSVQITGPMSEFGNTQNGPGLIQISGDDVTFKIIETDRVEVIPDTITISQMVESTQSKLIAIKDLTFTDGGGAFQGNRNYVASDGTGSVEIRIDNNTNMVGADIPTEPITLIGVVSRYGGVVQILPRDVDDLTIDINTDKPGDEYTNDQTFDIVTWNIEWFGSQSNGPTDVDLQIQNAATVIDTMDADIYALQEISNSSAFNSLMSLLDGYSGFIAPIDQTQKTAFIYKTETVDSLTASFLNANWSRSDSWAFGRYPYEFICRVTINGERETLYITNIHAKALGDEESYDRRVVDAQDLKNYLDTQRSATQTILLGDYNDYVLQTTYDGSTVSPYRNFINDESDYKIVTSSLEAKGLTSYSSFSMLDHIMITNELFESHIDGAESIENVTYLGNYLSTTSDHFPVKTRFIWGTPTSVEFDEKPVEFDLEQNYPNPFNPSTTISFNLNTNQTVSLRIYSVLGQLVAAPIQNQTYASGRHSIVFDASTLSSGTYFYQIQLSDGTMMTKSMTLIK